MAGFSRAAAKSPGVHALCGPSRKAAAAPFAFVFFFTPGLFELSVRAFQKLLGWLSCVVAAVKCESALTELRVRVKSFETMEALEAD